jgi:probable phosphoglycerate mutase
MTIVLIHAGPTQWDVEGRLAGNHPLPLTVEARAGVVDVASRFGASVSDVYRFKKNDACNEAADIVAKAAKIRMRESGDLDEVNLGLWQGLTESDLKFRYPKAYAQWDQNPLAVNPPEGEPLSDAIDRLRGGLRRILKRKHGLTLALPLRPMAMQIMLGVLRGEEPPTIASHLRILVPVETIDLPDEKLQSVIS